MLCLKEVKIDSKISNSLCLSKSATHSVDRDSGGEGGEELRRGEEQRKILRVRKVRKKRERERER
jgi:hypothetical protein